MALTEKMILIVPEKGVTSTKYVSKHCNIIVHNLSAYEKCPLQVPTTSACKETVSDPFIQCS